MPINLLQEHEIGFGAKPSKKDIRDFKDKVLAPAPYKTHHMTDISMLAVTHQRKVGICMAETVCRHVEYLYYKKTGVYTRLSRAFLYIVTKKFIDKDRDEGTSFRAGFKAAQDYGICPESVFPTNTNLEHSEFLDQKIPYQAWDEAKKFKMGAYIPIPTDISLLKAAISKYGLIAVRMELGEEWFTPSWKASDILPLRKPKKIISGHAVSLYGYDENNLNHLRNSWSEEWADKGNGYYDFDDYEPTEAWALTLEDPKDYKGVRFVTFDIIKKFMDLLRKIGTVAGFIK